MKMRFSWYTRCLSIMLFGAASAFIEAKELIQLQKILFNHVPESPLPNGEDKRIELGSLTLYFSERPVMHAWPKKNEGRNREVFFIPQVELKDAELKKKVAYMHRASTKGFHLTLKEEKFPVSGVSITLDVDDPQKVAYSYDSFDSIGMSPGVVFTFYNRSLINELKTKTSGKGLLRVACSQKKNAVVLDCGHGGLDRGAAPYKGIEEKSITLAVGLKVADLLKKGITVVLTRTNDATRSLDERAAVALKVTPTLFVSLHANASPRTSALGIETHVMNQALFRHVRDTFTPDERSFADKLFAERCSLSADCGYAIQHDLVTAALPKNQGTIDRGVKQSMTYVLLGTRVPAVLVEMGFVSHEKEARLLSSRIYQDELARGLCDGIMHALERLERRIA